MSRLIPHDHDVNKFAYPTFVRCSAFRCEREITFGPPRWKCHVAPWTTDILIADCALESHVCFDKVRKEETMRRFCIFQMPRRFCSEETRVIWNSSLPLINIVKLKVVKKFLGSIWNILSIKWPPGAKKIDALFVVNLNITFDFQSVTQTTLYGQT